MSWLLLLLVGLVAWLWWRLKNRRLLAMASLFPGPPTLPFVGNALMFMVRPEELAQVVKSLMTKYGSALRFWLGPDLNIIVSDPDDVRAYGFRQIHSLLFANLEFTTFKDFILRFLLTSSKMNFKGPQYKYMEKVIGGGILSGSGPKWRNHRKLAMPNYSKRAVESYNNIVNQEIDHLIERLKAEIKQNGCKSNIYKQIVKTTTYTVCQTLMGLSRKQTLELPHIQELIDTTPKMYDVIFDRMTKWYLQIDPVFWVSEHYTTQKRFTEIFTTTCDAIIQHRLEVLKDREEELRKLMESDKDSLKNTELSIVDRFILSQEMNAEELNQETFTIFTSSQEASAKISSSIILMMAYYPECQEKLYEEIRTVVGDDRWISDEDLKRMPYLDMVFSEAVRLFPIGAMIQRTIHEDITISSGTLPAGCSITVPIYHLQRDPRFWKDPDTFDPERFTPENVRLRHANCYLPFSLGPMDCLGRYFGMKLIKMICVRLLREYQVTSTESYKDLKMTIAVSASPLNSYDVILNRRK